MCLPRQARDIADHLCERPGDLARERRGDQEREGGGEEDEAPVALGESIDRRDRLDGHERRACRPERRRLRGESRSPQVDAAAADLHGLAFRPACDHAAVPDEQQRAMSGQRRRLAKERQDLVPERQRDRHGREHAQPIRDRGGRGDPRRPGEGADRTAVEVDPGVAVLGDPAQVGLVPGHDRALQRKRGGQLRRLDAQVGAERLEGGGADPGAAREGGGVLLPAAPVCVAVERHGDRDDERRGEQEDEHRVAGDGSRGKLSGTRWPAHVRSFLRRAGRTGALDHASTDHEAGVSPGRVTGEAEHQCPTTAIDCCTCGAGR